MSNISLKHAFILFVLVEPERIRVEIVTRLVDVEQVVLVSGLPVPIVRSTFVKLGSQVGDASSIKLV